MRAGCLAGELRYRTKSHEVRQRARRYFGTRIGDSREQLGRADFLPSELGPARIGNRRSVLFSHAVNRSEDFGLLGLRGRATKLVPAARVRDEHAAVGVFDHIGRMKVRLIAHEQIPVGRAECRAIRCEGVARDFAHVELRA